MKKTILAIMLALALVAIPISSALAATSADVEVTATPAFISISNAPGDWTVNGLTGNSLIAPATTYYSNPLGDTTSPTVGGAEDGECRFTVTNTSNVAIDLTVVFPDMKNGDASANSDTGSGGVGTFGAKTYFTGQASGAWIVAKKAGSDVGYSDLAATTDIKWGLVYASQTNAFTMGDAMTNTVAGANAVTITATAH